VIRCAPSRSLGQTPSLLMPTGLNPRRVGVEPTSPHFRWECYHYTSVRGSSPQNPAGFIVLLQGAVVRYYPAHVAPDGQFEAFRMQPKGANARVLLEPPVRIELTSRPYHGRILPLNYGGGGAGGGICTSRLFHEPVFSRLWPTRRELTWPRLDEA
jgi:hypothetical protein